MDSYNGIIEQSARRKNNLLLESIINSNETRNIGDATNKVLEAEEKSKVTNLLKIVETKRKEVMGREISKNHINMSKLSKRSLDIDECEVT